MNIVDQVAQIVARVRATPPAYPPANELEAIQQRQSYRISKAIEELPGMDNRDPMPHRFQEYTIYVGGGDGESGQASVLRWLRPLEIGAAPEVSALLPFSGGHVLITRYWACPGETLVGFRDETRVPEAAAVRFRRELGVLADHGKLHPMAVRCGAWAVGDSSGTIVLAPWSTLKTIDSDEDRDEMFAYVDHMLARHMVAS